MLIRTSHFVLMAQSSNALSMEMLGGRNARRRVRSVVIWHEWPLIAYQGNAAVGGALGVPYEFMTRGSFRCADMVSNGSRRQSAGTWSDDTSMTLATVDSLRQVMWILGRPVLAVQPTGYVLHTLPAALWRLTTIDEYADCVCVRPSIWATTPETTVVVSGGLAAFDCHDGSGDVP